MNFGLDEDELGLQSAVRELIRRQIPLERVRGAEGGPLDRDLWAMIADAGVFALRRNEDAGGTGLGSTAAVVVSRSSAAD